MLYRTETFKTQVDVVENESVTLAAVWKSEKRDQLNINENTGNVRGKAESLPGLRFESLIFFLASLILIS